jgi:hypothetical protein
VSIIVRDVLVARFVSAGLDERYTVVPEAVVIDQFPKATSCSAVQINGAREDLSRLPGLIRPNVDLAKFLQPLAIFGLVAEGGLNLVLIFAGWA